MRWSGIIGLALLATACGDDATGMSGDGAATADGAAGGIEPPADPTPPADVELLAWTCPEGWREVEGPAGLRSCDPWPASGVADCAPDEAHYPGTPGCVPIGTPCDPADDWATDLPSGAPVLYVSAAAPAGGDGTRAAPYATVRDAVAAASTGMVVAVGVGTYDEAVQPRSGVTLHGACVARARIANSTSSLLAGTIQVRGTDVAVQNLSLGGSRPAIAVTGGRSVRLAGVLVDDAEFLGINASSGGVVDGSDVVVRATRTIGSGPSVGQFGRGIECTDGGRVTLTRAIVEGNHDSAVTSIGAGAEVRLDAVHLRDTEVDPTRLAFGHGLTVVESGLVELTASVLSNNTDTTVNTNGVGTTVRLTDVVVRDGQGLFNGSGGRGIEMDPGTRLEGRRLQVVDNNEAGIFCEGDGITVDLEDVLVSGTKPGMGDDFGRGVHFERDMTALASRLVVSGNRDVGVFSLEGASATLSDLVVVDMLPRQVDLDNGRAIELETGAVVSVERARIERVRDAAILVRDEGTDLSLADVTVRDVDGRMIDGLRGRAVSVQDGARAQVARGRLEDLREMAVLALGGADARLEDLTVSNVQGAEGDGGSGRGVGFQTGATGEVLRLRVEDVRQLGLSTSTGASITAEDVVVSGLEGTVSDGTFGRALNVQLDSRATISRALFENGRDVGILVSGPASSLAATQVFVRGIRERACADSTCVDAPAGHGVVARDGARVMLSGFEVRDSALAGVVVASPEMDLTDGVVAGNPVGLNVQVDGYDLGRVMNGVEYRDNGINLDSVVLPVPEVAEDVTP